MINQNLLEHNYQGENPLRPLWLLFESNHLHLLIVAVVFIIKHSPVWSTIRNAGRIVVLKQGKIVETGTHDELIKLNGVYTRLQARKVM